MTLTPQQQCEVERLVPYARKIAASFAADDDFESEAYLALCEAVASFDVTRSRQIDQWCGVVIKRRLLNLLRNKGRLPRLFHDLDRHAAPADALNTLLEGLTDTDKQIAIDRWVYEKSLRKIALETGLKTPQVEQRLARIREYLHEQ